MNTWRAGSDKRSVGGEMVEFEVSGVQAMCLCLTRGQQPVSRSFNPLKTKRNLFYIRTQCVPRCKHSPSRL
jgi:hypothetical protein